MNKFLLSGALLLIAGSAFAGRAAESAKAKVGHMCCGSCKAGATAGMKKLEWVDTVEVTDDSVSVTAKAGQSVDLVSFMDGLNKAGFPANNITVNGPVTLSIAHLCCGKCTAGLTTALAESRSMVLDKDKTKIDQAAKTCVIAPQAGKEMNIIPILRSIERAGYGASKASVHAGAVVTK